MWVVMKKICCEKCFEISDIQNFIKEFKQSGNCDYCGSCNVFILDIKKVGEFILESVKRAYEDAANHVSYSSRDGGYLMSTYSITEILLEKEEIFSDRLDEPRSEELIPDDGTEYVKRDTYDLTAKSLSYRFLINQSTKSIWCSTGLLSHNILKTLNFEP
jgi:hypothetical protein